LAVVLRAGLRAADGGGRPPAFVMAGVAALGALSAAYAVCLASLLAADGPVHGAAAAGQAAAAMAALAGGDASAAVRGGWAGPLHVLLALVVLAAALAVRAVLWPAPPRDGHDDEEHARAASIVAEHGGDSLAPFALRADKAFFFAGGGMLAYRTLGGTAVVSGDPVGPPGAAPAILAAFLRFAAAHGWDVVVTAAGERHLDAYRALGLRTLRIGSEAVADPAALSLAGRAHKSLRKAVNRVERRGWTVEVVRASQLTATLQAELARVQAAWRAGRPRIYGFAMTMDRLWGAPEDARDVYVLGRAPGGALHGFLRFLPYADGLSLDAMRRAGGEPNGFTEALVVAGLHHAAATGCREVSLNFAGFAHVMAADAILGRGGRALRAVLRLLHRRFQLERLARFNERFDPAWRPRFLVYTSATRLPAAALRVLQAEAYVRPPRPRPRADAWRPASAPVRRPATTGGAAR
ncbi:MAG TPA: phosphatidylglycerol lysyltransferase domain-containing protein, partial [Solirubrobacteraceae bacterium]|nr:phosphatidylglycerol lysyltransferase domain-containing protein [Solirubrobacteraceae bacterium]